MSQAERHDELPEELRELSGLIRGLNIDAESRATLTRSVQIAGESVHRRKRILRLVQEALEQLRLDVKYLMFDLEVTRDERDALQDRLEEMESEF